MKIEIIHKEVIDESIERKEIAIQDLVIWAVRDQKVMEWLDQTNDKIGGVKSQMGIVEHAMKLGATIDQFKSVTNMRVPEDAIKVGLAIQALPIRDQAILLANAKKGAYQYKPVGKMMPCDSKGVAIDIKQGALIKGVTKQRVGDKVVRVKPYCRVTSAISTVDLFFYRPRYNHWVDVLEKVQSQLSVLKGFILLTHKLLQKMD